MLLSDVIDLAKIRLRNISVSKDSSTLRRVVYLGMSDLYNKFSLKIKSEAIYVNSNMAYYSLKNNDVLMILDICDTYGISLKQTDVLNTPDWDYKLVNYRSFTLHNPQNHKVLNVLYKASPEVFPFTDTEDLELDLPDAMLEALLLFMAYAINSTISSFSSSNGRQGTTEADILYKRYQEECLRLENQGYRINLATESRAINERGFV